MDIKDQTSKLNQARAHFNDVKDELRQTYEKNLKDAKETFEHRENKMSRNYDEKKSILEEQNHINNEHFSSKTKEAISKGQEDFKTRLKENISKFEAEKNKTRNELNDKLTNVSEAYKKSFSENEQYQNQIKKSMAERYSSGTEKVQNDFQSKFKNLEDKTKKEIQATREHDRQERMALSNNHNKELDSLRDTANEEKYKEISRLKADNENLRTTFERENNLLKDRQADRVADLIKLKDRESDETQKNYQNLQQEIRKKNLEGQHRQNVAHKEESKELEKNFNDNIRNIQNVANQKLSGGGEVLNLKEEISKNKISYENRLKSTRDELEKNKYKNFEKVQLLDSKFREQARIGQEENRRSLATLDTEASKQFNQAIYKHKEKNNNLIEKYKTETTQLRNEADEKLSIASEVGKNKLKDQRIEFGRVVNTLNDKNSETISTLKNEYSKDKTIYIEKSKKDFNEEKVDMKNDFNRQLALKEDVFEKRLSEMEKKAGQIIDSYEKKLTQVARKADLELDSLKSQMTERQFKEDQATKVALEAIQQENEVELSHLRDKYERMIAKDRIIGEQQVNRIIQKYEDQLTRERIDSQKELNMRTSESQTQLERLFKSSELEKETLINQYEQRIESMRLANLAKESTQKS